MIGFRCWVTCECVEPCERYAAILDEDYDHDPYGHEADAAADRYEAWLDSRW